MTMQKQREEIVTALNTEWTRLRCRSCRAAWHHQSQHSRLADKKVWHLSETVCLIGQLPVLSFLLPTFFAGLNVPFNNFNCSTSIVFVSRLKTVELRDRTFGLGSCFYPTATKKTHAEDLSESNC